MQVEHATCMWESELHGAHAIMSGVACLPGLARVSPLCKSMLLACFLHILFSPLCLAFRDPSVAKVPEVGQCCLCTWQSSLHAIRVAIKCACSEVCLHPESELQASFSVLLWPALCSCCALFPGLCLCLSSLLACCLALPLSSLLACCLALPAAGLQAQEWQLPIVGWKRESWA